MDEAAPEPGLIETLAAGVAHEVRNPLNSVQINLSILEQELLELLPNRNAHVFSVLGKIAGEIKRLDDFVSEFLRFARPPKLNVVRLPVRPLITDLAAFIAPECSKKGVTLGLDLRGPESARLDGFQLKQAILNLVLNALQATPAGGQVAVRTTGDKSRLVVAVVDNGEGMGPGTLEKALTPFFTTREGGTGLGLPLVRRITEQHGGSVEIQSAPGQGTTVTMVFPATAGSSTVSGGRSILLVEDHAESRASLAYVLEKRGETVHQAANGRAALSAARRERLHALILDLKLPDMDGLSVLDAVLTGSSRAPCNRRHRLRYDRRRRRGDEARRVRFPDQAHPGREPARGTRP